MIKYNPYTQIWMNTSIIQSGIKLMFIRIDRNIAFVKAIMTHTPAIIFQYFKENKNGTREIRDNPITNKGDKNPDGWVENKLGASHIHTGIASIQVIKKNTL